MNCYYEFLWVFTSLLHLGISFSLFGCCLWFYVCHCLLISSGMWEVSSGMHFEPTSLIKTFLSLYFPFAEMFTALVIIFLFLLITISKIVKSHRFIKISPPPGDSHALRQHRIPLFPLLWQIPSSLRPAPLGSDMLSPPTDLWAGMAGGPGPGPSVSGS